MVKNVGKKAAFNRKKVDKKLLTETHRVIMLIPQADVEKFQDWEFMFEVISRTVAAVSGLALSRDSTLRMEASTVA